MNCVGCLIFTTFKVRDFGNGNLRLIEEFQIVIGKTTCSYKQEVLGTVVYVVAFQNCVDN